ncbi:MAG: insulinase family protein [Acholeplasmataceae bacterium]|nr:insulinase family protein [Acholeplasmataceae bacterium]
MLLIKNDFKTIQFAIYFTDLDKEETSVYRFLLPRLLTSHTNQYINKTKMNEKLEDLYGAYFKTRIERIGNLSVVSIVLTIVDPLIVDDDRLINDALELLNQVLYEHDLFNEDLFLEEKRMIIEQWETLYDKKRLYAQTKFYEHFFKDDSYGYPISGSLKDIKKLTVQKLYQYYKDVFLNNSKKMIVNGRISNQHIEKIESMMLHDSHMEHPFIAKFRPSRELLIVEEETKMQQAILKLGYHFPVFREDRLFHAAVLLDTILGGYPESRLFKIIREKEGLCYDISSSYDFYKGVLIISSGVDHLQKDRALTAIKELVIELIENGIHEDELKNAKAYYEYQIKSSLDSQSFLTKRAFIRDLMNHNETIEQRLEAIENVTIKDVEESLRKITLDTIYVLYGGQDDKTSL